MELRCTLSYLAVAPKYSKQESHPVPGEATAAHRVLSEKTQKDFQRALRALDLKPYIHAAQVVGMPNSLCAGAMVVEDLESIEDAERTQFVQKLIKGEPRHLYEATR